VATLLSPETANHTGSRFSPDGSRVAFWSPGEDGYDLIIAKADLSGARTVSSHNARTWAIVWSPDGKQLVFASSATNVADLYLASADSGAARQLTSDPGFEVPISWRPGGDRITFNATREGEGLRGMILDLRTGQSSPVPSRESPVARWSPDGTRLGLEGFGSVSSLWVADSVGNGAKQLTTEGRETAPSWSPDGSEIAYVSRRTGTGDIWVVPVAGGPPRQLTRDIRNDDSPRWSPDGKWIAFVSQRGRQTDLWVVPAAGGAEIRITDDPAEEGNPQWIGSRLAYHTGAGGTAVWAVSATGGAERRVTPDSIEAGEINPSPDGTELAYEVIRGGGVSDLQVMPVAGGAPRTVATGGSINTQANWSPDGKTIAFLSDRAGNMDVWVVAAAGGEPRRLTEFSTPEANPQWSPDGSAVYFTSRWEAAPFSDLWKVPAAGGTPERITRTGTINGLAVSLVGADVLVQAAGGKGGRTILARVLPTGKLEPLWDQRNVTGFSWLGFMPKADSVAINAELPGGGNGSYLISTKTGHGRQLLDRGDLIGDFSPDGRWLGYWSGTATLELGVIDMKDGSHRLLTKSPESETSYWWSADNHTIYFTRNWQRRRIAVVDLSGLRVADATSP
jgi:Tol biopolymer transport system component